MSAYPLMHSVAMSDLAEARRVLNLNPAWQFHKEDIADACNPAFDDSGWSTVSLPHTWNDTDSFRNFGRGGHQGEADLWTGVAWYRKAFEVPPGQEDKRVYLEFEGVRQVAEVYLNGHRLGINKTGFIPFGFELTEFLKQGEENVIAVRVDNRFDPHFEGDTPWHHPNWHPPHGGIYRNVRLHFLNPVHVTLPLYADLQTEGIYARTVDLSARKATVAVTAQFENGLAEAFAGTVSFVLLGHEGDKVVRSDKVPFELGARQLGKVTVRLPVPDPRLWEPAYPYLYHIRVEIHCGDSLLDTAYTVFGIRNYRWDANTGFWINGHPLKLHGWGQKPTQAWAGLGAALPDWLSDYTLRLMKHAGGNMIRWGHSAGSAAALASGDKYGFVTIMPGVDGERDCFGEAWETRRNAFRDMIIYFRNHPSICVWEGGNYNISVPHTKELRDIVDRWDPEGKRYFGFRMSSPAMRPYIDLELGTVGRVRAHPHLPVVETEYDRAETPRRVWDAYSPPHYGNLGPGSERNTYQLDSEGFAVHAIKEWWTLFGAKPDHSGGANWIFSDGPHGTRQYTDVARATGEVDGVRLPKEAYFALQATWDTTPRVHIIGHWNYPEGTEKTLYAVARADRVELQVNGRRIGDGERSHDTLFTWRNVAFEPGEIKAIAYRDGKVVAEQVKETAGPAVALRLTPRLAPGGWRADGSDIALIDVEVVDEKGRRCPTDEGRVDFEVEGPAVWRGSYNSGREDSTNERFFDTECGINRASLRSTLEPGSVKVTARREGLESDTLILQSQPVELEDGTLAAAPANFSYSLGARPDIDADALLQLAGLRKIVPAYVVSQESGDDLFASFAYTGNGRVGQAEPIYLKALAYTDDALLYLDSFPGILEDTQLIRTANMDRSYWANDYIVASTAASLDLYIAHDVSLPKPAWLQDYKPVGKDVTVNGRPLGLYVRSLKAGEEIRISGNVDQGHSANDSVNFLIFACPQKNGNKSAP